MIEDSAEFWYPKIKNIDGINVPITEMIEMDDDKVVTMLASIDLFIQEYGSEFEEALKKFTFPVFIRTDELARKHDWNNTCYVERKEDFYPHLRTLVADSELIKEKCRAILIREFLQLDSAFTWFNAMPVSRERRYFVRDGKITCHHPYWQEEAFDRLPDELREKLRELNHESIEEIAVLSGMATIVAERLNDLFSMDTGRGFVTLDGAFSIDFAMDVNGKWWLLDCATARNSWHPDDCKFKNLGRAGA